MNSRKEIYYKILYFYFQDYFYSLPKHERAKFSSVGFFGKLYNMLLTLYVVLKENRFFSGNKGNNAEQLAARHWVFMFGKNNYTSTRFLKGKEVVFVTDRFRSFYAADEIIVLPYVRRLKDFLFFFNLLSFLKTKERRTSEIFDLIFNSLGSYESFDRIIRRYAPLSITFSNDHSVVPRALFYAAKANAIPTIYVQHATVTKDFPPLEFDLNLLEGLDAVDKYKSKGVSGEIRLIGMPRFDAFVQKRKISSSLKINTIGMAFNTLDSIDVILSMVKKIVGTYSSMHIVIRKHPKDKRDFSTPFLNLKNVSFSDASREDPFDFILQCDLLLAGNSSIHLDARLLNVASLFYDFDRGSKVSDLYGFVSKGFVREIASEDEMIQMLAVPMATQNIYLQAKYYNEAVGEPWENKTSDRARVEIEKFYSNIYHTNISK
jgi:hypothetical protein